MNVLWKYILFLLAQPSFEVGVNTSLPFTEAKAEVVLTETGMNTSMAVEQSEKSDASCNTPMMKDDKPKQQQLCGVGINTSTSTIDREVVLSESNNSTLEEDSLQVEPRSMMTSSSFVEEQLTEELGMTIFGILRCHCMVHLTFPYLTLRAMSLAKSNHSLSFLFH